MKTESRTQEPPNHLPPHHISEILKKEMDDENKRPPDPNGFLDRLQRKSAMARERGYPPAHCVF
jgi:hypothetical protein